MAIDVANEGYTLGSVDQGAHTNAVTLKANYSISSFPLGGLNVNERTEILSPFDRVSEDFGPTTSGRFYSHVHTVTADTTFQSRPKVFQYDGGPSFPPTLWVAPTTVTLKAAAVTATASAPTASGVTADGASIECDFFPNTAESIVTATLQYRVFGSGSGWTNATTSGYATSGYTETTASATLSGLDGSTTYEVRLVVTRTTVNETSLTSASGTFTTDADEPVVTTGEASSIGAEAATLNGTLVANGILTTLSFEYGLTAAYGSTAAGEPNSSSSDTSFSATLSGPTGLTPETTYHFRAKGVHAGGTVLGSDNTFTTAAEPLAAALEEDHLLIFDYDAKYGVQKAFVFMAASPAATSSDKFLSAAAPWSAAECQVTKDGGAAANATNAPTRIGSTAFYTITLTAAELQAENVLVWITDSGNAARDVVIRIRTKLELGQFNIDATQYGSNTVASTITGVGTSPALNCVGGTSSNGDIYGVLRSHTLSRGTAQAGGASTITLDSSLAVASDDYYNGCVIGLYSGSGTEQFRIITDYVGSTKVATVNRSWSSNPSSSSKYVILPGPDMWDIPASGELSALPTSTSTFGKFLQFCFQRFAYKRTQTGDTFTMLKADSSTTLATGAVSDNGTIQSADKLA